VDKSDIFEILNLHLLDPDPEIQHTALQLIQVTSTVTNCDQKQSSRCDPGQDNVTWPRITLQNIH
jgi:hypothetical protein